MAHFAKIENEIVVNVIVVADEHENNATEYLESIGLPGMWVKTSYNRNIRKKFAAVGDTYDPRIDAFVPPRPSADCTWDAVNWSWNCPIDTSEVGA